MPVELVVRTTSDLFARSVAAGHDNAIGVTHDLKVGSLRQVQEPRRRTGPSRSWCLTQHKRLWQRLDRRHSLKIEEHNQSIYTSGLEFACAP